MTPAPDTAPIAPAIVDAAIVWYVRQSSGLMSSKERTQLTHWLAGHPDHGRAWLRLQHMSGHLHTDTPRLAPGVARSVLGRLPDLERRRVLRLLSWSLAGGVSLYLGREQLDDAAFPASYRTATGEQREVRLADNTLLKLNTDSAIDVRFDDASRRVRLRRGEIHIVTAADPAGRPFWVETRDRRLVPVGTRFTVTQRTNDTLLGVTQGAVDVMRNDHGETWRVNAGQQLAFGGAAGDTRQALDESRQAWTDAMISAENRRLDDLLAELARYRHGYLRCTPEAGELRITGTWPLRGDDPTQDVLASLERRLPIRIQQLTRYWTKVDAR